MGIWPWVWPTHTEVDTRQPLPIATRAGIRTLTFGNDQRITVDMGAPQLQGETKVSVGPASVKVEVVW